MPRPADLILADTLAQLALAHARRIAALEARIEQLEAEKAATPPETQP